MHQQSIEDSKEIILGRYSPLAAMHQVIARKNNAPRSYRIADSACLKMPGKGVWFSCQAIDRTSDKILLCQEKVNVDTGKEEVHIDFLDIATLQLSKRLTFDNLSGSVEINRNNVKQMRKLRCLRLLDADHLVFGLADGWLQIVRISDGAIVNSAKTGGTIASLDVAQGLVAVSLFPGPENSSDDMLEACGIKVYSIENLVSGKPFRLLQHLDSSCVGVLPRIVRFNHDVSAFICIKGMMRDPGFTNVIEMVNYNGKSRQTIFREDDRNLSMCISEKNTLGSFFLATREKYHILNAAGAPLYKGELPEELHSHEGDFLDAYISPNGEKCLLLHNGILYLATPDKTLHRCFEKLGWVSFLFFLSEEMVLCVISNGDSFDLAVVDLEKHTCLQRISTPRDLRSEEIVHKAFDIALDGSLCFADRQGNLRLFNNDLSGAHILPSQHGNVRQIRKDPLQNRLVVLMQNQAVFILSLESRQLVQHVGKDTGKPIIAGSGKRSISTTRRSGWPWMWCNAEDISVRFESGRYVCCIKGSCECTVSTYIYQEDPNKKSTTDHIKFELSAQAVGSVDLHDKAVILLEDGTLCCIDPWEYSGLPESMVRIPLGPSTDRFGGICLLEAARIAVWTDKRISLYAVGSDWTIEPVCEAAVTGIKNIKWDDVANRMLIAFEWYIGFYSQQLIEMYRLYLLTGGEHLFYVPYPTRLRYGLNVGHPGYFWCSTAAGKDLFELLDAKGNPIQEPQRQDSFLDDYNSEFMVREALSDYSRFCAELAGGVDRAGNCLESPYALLAIAETAVCS